MNTKTTTQEKRKTHHKSKRLSSLIWLLILWGGVRGCSEMDGVSWKRAFDGVALMIGLWPASIFLMVSMMPKMEAYELIFRWASLFVVVLSFVAGFLVFEITSSEEIANHFATGLQVLVTLIIFGWIAFKWVRGKQ